MFMLWYQCVWNINHKHVLFTGVAKVETSDAELQMGETGSDGFVEIFATCGVKKEFVEVADNKGKNTSWKDNAIGELGEGFSGVLFNGRSLRCSW